MRLMITVAAALQLTLLCGRSLDAARPNVLLLCADDHAAYVSGCYGNPLARTPNIDALASGGIRFDRAYCSAPVCTASRAAFITGRYPRTVGVTLLRTPLPEQEITLADALRAAGYDTAVVGKTHFNSDSHHGFDQLIGRRDWNKWLRAKGGSRPVPQDVEYLPQWRPFRQPARLWVNAVYRPYELHDADMWTTFYAEWSAAFIEQRRERPWFLMVSLNEPHSPFRFPVEYRDRYDPSQFPLPKIGPEDDDQIPAEFRELSPSEVQGIQAAYYTSTEYMDKSMGTVLDALQRSGQANQTLVVYIGDHGYMLGQHGRIEKHCSFEEAVRAPLIMRYPPLIKAGMSNEALVEFIDIMPTVLQICDVEIPAAVQGRSLIKVVTGQTNQHRDQVFVEYAQNDEVLIRDSRWKLVFIRGQRERTDGYRTGRPLPGATLKLYDTLEDPGEFTNLADRPEHRQRVARMVDLLADWLKRTSRQPERIPDTEDPLVILEHCVQPRDVGAARQAP